MRPTYETNADHIVEELIADQLRDTWKCALSRTPRKYPYDYVAEVNGKVAALIEIKSRNNAHDKYPTYMISADKIVTCQTAASTLGLRFFLVVSFNDQLMYWVYRKDDFTVDLGGRRDRNDDADWEPVVHIPMTHFKKVTT